MSNTAKNEQLKALPDVSKLGIDIPDLLARYANRSTKRVAFVPAARERGAYYHVRPYIVGAHWRRYPKRQK